MLATARGLFELGRESRRRHGRRWTLVYPARWLGLSLARRVAPLREWFGLARRLVPLAAARPSPTQLSEFPADPTIEIPDAPNLGSPGARRKQFYAERIALSPPRVYRWADATVRGPTGAIQTRVGDLVAEFSPDFAADRFGALFGRPGTAELVRDFPPGHPLHAVVPEHRHQLQVWDGAAVEVPGGAVCVATPSGGNYTHWMLEEFPRLLLAARSGVCLPKTDAVIVSGGAQPFQADLLARAGVRPEAIRPTRHGDAPVSYRGRELITPSYLAPIGVPSLTGVRLLRELFALGERPANGARLLITRGPNVRSRYKDPVAVLRVFGAHGFEPYDPGAHSLDENVGAFRRASHVAGAHGSGFANLVFASPGCRVLDLFPAGLRTPYYQILASHCGLDYACYDATPPTDWATDFTGEFALPERELSEILSRWLGNPFRTTNAEVDGGGGADELHHTGEARTIVSVPEPTGSGVGK